MSETAHEAIRRVALMSTARGCGFGGLAIITAMMGFADYPPNALKFGGIASLLAASILILKAWRAPRKSYKSTEVWLLLPEAERPAGEQAQSLIVAARTEAFYRFAFLSAIIAAIFLTGGLIDGLWRG